MAPLSQNAPENGYEFFPTAHANDHSLLTFADNL